jgi:hypothetical protein
MADQHNFSRIKLFGRAGGWTLFSWWRAQREWCCPTFRALHEARHDRDLFLFVRPPGWASSIVPSFWLAFRSICQCDLPRLPAQGLPPDLPVSIARSRRILYCPGCGAELERFYSGGRWEKLYDPVIAQEFELPTSQVVSTEPTARPGGAGLSGF